MHHEKFHGNYGLYFTIWDRLCGTLRPDSMDKVAEVHGRIHPRHKQEERETTMGEKHAASRPAF